MKDLLISFSISLAASICLFSVLTFVFEMEAHGAAGIAGLPFIASHHIYEALERDSDKRKTQSSRNVPVRAPDDFYLSWKVSAVLYALFLFGVIQITPLLVMFCAVVADGGDNPKMYFAVATPFNLIAAYAAGRWLGMRVSRFGIPAVLIGGTATIVAAKLLDFYFVTGDRDLGFLAAKGFADLGIFCTVGSILVSIPGLIGYWRGRSYRLVRYFRYLLTSLSPDTRETLVNMAYEEAARLS